MEPRPDTSSSSSGHFRGQWSFLATAPPHAQPRSLPPSTYLPQSDRSSILPHQFHGTNGSRSTLARNFTTGSTGGRSSATIPSQPVLIRVHSAGTTAHQTPSPRPHRNIKMSKNNGLPAISEFSIEGILSSIHEDIQSDVNTISEILGRSRFVLANQHESHMPPLGEIRALSNALPSVEEVNTENEGMLNDEVFILRDDVGLVEGSQHGSAAYGLLERLQAIPRTRGIHGEPSYGRIPRSLSSPSSHLSPIRHNSSPSVLDGGHPERGSTYREPQRASRQLLQSSARTNAGPPTTPAIASESFLFATANGISIQDPYLEPEALHYLQTDGFEADEGSESNGSNNRRTMRERVQSLMHVSDPTGFSAWLQGQSSDTSTSTSIHGAEDQLRDLLGR